MVKATELRIGNKIKVFDDIVDVTDVCDDGIIGTTAYFDGQKGCCGCTEEMADGILLTSQLLGRMGGATTSLYYQPGDDKITIQIDELKVEITASDIALAGIVRSGKGIKSLPRIQYVHQLQNLYFSLTGEELTIKETA